MTSTGYNWPVGKGAEKNGRAEKLWSVGKSEEVGFNARKILVTRQRESALQGCEGVELVTVMEWCVSGDLLTTVLLPELHQQNCVGAIIEESLFWKEHINAILNIISKSLGVFYRMKNASPLLIMSSL